jgi:hypothetical protein
MRMRIPGLMAAVLAALGGCASQEYYTPAAPRVVRTLSVGQTTPADLLRTAGDPDSIVTLDDGCVVYTWLDTVMLSRGLSAFPLWIIGGSRRTTDASYCLEVRFRNGLMSGHRYTSTRPLEEAMKPFAASGECAPGPDPAAPPQAAANEGRRP